MTLSVAHQVAAGLCWLAAGGKAAAAAEALRNWLTAAGLDLPANVHGYVKTWGPRLGRDGVVESRARASGRRSKLTTRQVAACFEECVGVAVEEGRPCASVLEFARRSPAVAARLAAAGVTARTLTRRMKKDFPTFKYIKLRGRRPFTPAQLGERRRVCTAHLAAGLEVLRRTVWIDQKTFYFTKETVRGWVDAGKQDTYPRPTSKAKYKGKDIKLKYYIAVNALLGPVALVFTTGSSGRGADHVTGHRFKVRATQTGWGVCVLAHASQPASGWLPT